MLVVNKIVMMKIDEIKPYIRNPRLNEKTVEKLCQLIPQVGFNVPLVVDREGIIVKGHARYYSAVRLGMEEVPCVITEADEESIKLDRIADNRVQEFTEWDMESLQHELNTLTIDHAILDFRMGAEMPQLNIPDVRTEDIEVARQRQEENVGSMEHRQYLKTVCEKCGHIGYIEKATVLDELNRTGG